MADTFSNGESYASIRSKINATAVEVNTNKSDLLTKAEYAADILSGTSGTFTSPSKPGIAAYILTNSGARDFELENPDSVVEGAKVKVQNGQDPGGLITITVAAGTGSTSIDFGTQVVVNTTAATIEFLKLNNQWWSR